MATPLMAPMHGLVSSSMALTGLSSAVSALAARKPLLAEFLQIEPGGEGAIAGAGQDDDADAGIGLERAHRGGKFAAHLADSAFIALRAVRA